MAKLWKLPVVFNLREQRIRYGYVYGSSLRQHGLLHAWRLRPGNLGNFSPRFCNKTLTLIFVLSGGRNGRIYIYIYIFFYIKKNFSLIFTLSYSLLDAPFQPFVIADYNQALLVLSFNVLCAIPTYTGSFNKHFHFQI